MSTNTELDALIAEERKKANARIAKLRREAQAEQRKVDLRVVELLKAQNADAYERLVAQARGELADERAARSRRASSTSAPQVPLSPQAASPAAGHRQVVHDE